ncbi:hypothetical protein M426DRAFT_26626 [Hypoxylon sp. CI-4A]|nr:hypothetical protein M426DRAFT_26626 [Hypoxylon sp. CI-4A]
MSFGAQHVMPGAFRFESQNSGSSMSGVHPGLFQPPTSPSSSSSLYLGKSNGNLFSETPPTQNVKRKRQGAGDYTPYNDWAMATSDMDNRRIDQSEADVFMDGAERRYVLAGQMETPNGVAPADIQEAMEDSIYSDVDYRRALATKHAHVENESPSNKPTTTSSLSGSQQTSGWGSLALSTIGGVVGKVFEFCKTGVFRGFYAGGGKGYEIRPPPRQESIANGEIWCNEHDIPTLPSFDSSTALNNFPESDYNPFTHERGTPESTPPPAAKRRQIGIGTPGEELRRNWVMVQEPAEKARRQSVVSPGSSTYTPQQTYPPVLRRRISRPVSRVNTPSFNKRPSSRMSYAGATSGTEFEPASFASPRAGAQSPARLFTPSRIPVSTRPQSPAITPARFSQQPSFIPSPSVKSGRSHRRNHSTASAASTASGKVRRGDSMHEFDDNSPRLDAEAKNLAARMMQEEMEADIRMNDFNARLRDMIRQGKEALGTTVEIELGNDGRSGDPWEDA